MDNDLDLVRTDNVLELLWVGNVARNKSCRVARNASVIHANDSPAGAEQPGADVASDKTAGAGYEYGPAAGHSPTFMSESVYFKLT